MAMRPAGVIGHAAFVCATRLWAVRHACLRAQLDGEACDVQSTDAAMQAARVAALNAIDPFCTDRLVGDLGSLGLFEVQGDLGLFWGGFDDAMVSAVYGPIADAGPMPPTDSTTQRCVGAAARAAGQLARVALESQHRALDRIAHGGFTPSTKERLVQRAAARVARARHALADQIVTECSDSEFTSIYQRPIDTFLEGIAQRGDCLGGAAYVQPRVVCPPPVCGNGIKEPGEIWPGREVLILWPHPGGPPQTRRFDSRAPRGSP